LLVNAYGSLLNYEKWLSYVDVTDEHKVEYFDKQCTFLHFIADIYSFIPIV